MSSRKRPAPGTSPGGSAQQMQQSFDTPSQLSSDQFLRWGQNGDNASYSDSSGFNLDGYGANMLSNPQFQQSVNAPSTQLARRPVNRQLVSTAPRATYDSLVDPWGSFGDDRLLDPQNGMLDENDNVELLEERAAIAKRDAQSKRKQISPFVQKLSSFLDESKNTELIRWSDRGDSFVVLDEDEFAKTLIPELFKHNNYASFVRQLNMYGFHKRVGLSDNSMKASERKNKSPSEYYNPYFKRGHPNLLWLINKPKGGGQKKKGSKVKNEDGIDADSDEDGREGIDDSFNNGFGQNSVQSTSRALSAAPEAGPLQRRELAHVQHQLQDIQKQQGAISNAISRLRKDHNQLYQQAVAFQTLHDRHESSINAILTFLATVYNRSLDGQGGQNIADIFSNAIPQQQHQGNVVDIGDLGNQQQQNAANASPMRRAQRLLMAPPVNAQQSQRISPPPTTRNESNQFHIPHLGKSGAIEEVFETSPSKSPHVKAEGDPYAPQQDIMSLIHNTNAQVGHPGANRGMNFPDVLSHYENANGNSPLTSEQRNDMLNLIANTASTSGSNNALISPTPPPQPTLQQLGYTQAEIDELMRMQKAQDAKLAEVQAIVQPLSPSGSIPGLADGQYFNTDATDTLSQGNNLDLDQYLDTGAYYTNGDGTDFGFDGLGSAGTGMGDVSNFDFGGDGTMDAKGGGADDGGGVCAGSPSRIVEAAESSTESPPEIKMERGDGDREETAQEDARQSLNKKRKKL
ncbi:MAG: stress-responsive transcription factor hsf1 [Claussenomyces sp. TS43310]|nr:MAG: stress-responsive transcription factor hsf1 [Claussenomyces sp. TS43310]